MADENLIWRDCRFFNEKGEEVIITDDLQEETIQVNENNNSDGAETFQPGFHDLTSDSDQTLNESVKQQAKNRINRYSQKQRGGVLRYPLEALTEHTDYLQIDIEKYVPIGNSYISAPGDDNRYVRGNFQTNRAGRRSSRKLSTKPLINAGTILLPIPANLQDTNNVRYDTSS